MSEQLAFYSLQTAVMTAKWGTLNSGGSSSGHKSKSPHRVLVVDCQVTW